MIGRTALLAMLLTTPALAGPVAVPDTAGKDLTVAIQWRTGVDLDLFLTDPNGETVYFANRRGKSGVTMGIETGCPDIGKSGPPYGETVKLPKAMAGRYRVSVDFIRDCGKRTTSVDFEIKLFDGHGAELNGGKSSVSYRSLDTVSWEFIVQ